MAFRYFICNISSLKDQMSAVIYKASFDKFLGDFYQLIERLRENFLSNFVDRVENY